EGFARACKCGGSTQNSVQSIMAIFGPSNPEPPTVEFVRPRPGDRVVPGFPMEVRADHPIRIDRIEFWVNGAKIGETAAAPYVYNSPASLVDGVQRLEARAYYLGTFGTARIEVI